MLVPIFEDCDLGEEAAPRQDHSINQDKILFWDKLLCTYRERPDYWWSFCNLLCRMYGT